MKVKLLVMLGELILGHGFSDDEPRADMYLPIKLFAFALVLLVFGVVAAVYAVMSLSLVAVIVAVVCILLGIAAVLCWKNQTIVIKSYDVFEYTTFLGHKSEYRFSDITGLRRNNDSMTLFVGKNKIHIESMAILSDALVAGINKALSEKAH